MKDPFFKKPTFIKPTNSTNNERYFFEGKELSPIKKN